MSFDSFLQPRREVLDDSILGIVDLANLKEPDRLESEPGRFFDITYPTHDIARIIQALDARFTEPQGHTPGLFLLEGLKGSGKSHVLLLVYHLLQSRDEAETWLARHHLTCRLPPDLVVIVNKFTDQPFGAIWDLLYCHLGDQGREQNLVHPSLDEMQALIGNRRLVLILDELERGIQVVRDPTLQAQNLAFLQMLSEWANRSTQVTLLASIYSDQVEPGSTLKRVSPVRVHFQHAPDRARVVLYRLFENYLDFDSRTVRATVESYINVWRRHMAFNGDDWTEKMLEAYPFSPDLLELMLERVPARGGFQDVRGALGFLANMVRLTRGQANLITPGLLPVNDQEIAIRLSDLDPNQLAQRARSNFRDLAGRRPRPPLIEPITSATLLYTLTGTGRNIGASREELIRSTMQPGTDVNDFERTLLAMQRYAANFHVAEGHYFFDQTETPDAKVELRALPKDDAVARAELRKILLDLFSSTNALVFAGAAEAQEALNDLDRNDLRYVLAPRTLSAEERHELYFGLSQRNQVVLLEPGDRTFDLNHNSDLLKWTKRYLAAEELIPLSQGEAQRAYQRIKQNEVNQITGHLRRVGLRYVRFEAYGSSAGEDEVDDEPLGQAMTATEVRNLLSSRFFPSDLVMEHLCGRLDELMGRTVREIEQEYKAILGFPLLAKAHSLTNAVVELCRDQRRLISLRHPTRGSFCGEQPGLRHNELLEAVIEAPLDPSAPALRPTTGSLLPQDTSLPPFTAVRPAGAEPVGTDAIAPTAPSQQEMIRTLYMTSAGELRQEIASRLQGRDEVRISRVRFTVFGEQNRTDLGRFSSGLRGSLTGEGDLTIEITITFDGEYRKAAVERMAEQLPIVLGGEYMAEITIG